MINLPLFASKFRQSAFGEYRIRRSEAPFDLLAVNSVARIIDSVNIGRDIRQPSESASGAVWCRHVGPPQCNKWVCKEEK